jgi:hypothetical protein
MDSMAAQKVTACTLFSMNTLAPLLFDCLRRMDAEADTTCGGEPTGLNYYGAHARPELKKPQTEPKWSKRLATLLRESGYDAQAEVPYPNLPPGKRNRCDVVVSTPQGDRLWLELKGAWKHYWMTHGEAWIYRSYLLHPLIEGLDTKSHTAALDIEKLKTITAADGTHVGLLLVGFDSVEHDMDGDVAELVRLATLDSTTWYAANIAWCDARRKDENVKAWAWLRSVR